MNYPEDFTDCRSCQTEGQIIYMVDCDMCGYKAHRHCLVLCERCREALICTQCVYETDDHKKVCQECITPEIDSEEVEEALREERRTQ